MAKAIAILILIALVATLVMAGGNGNNGKKSKSNSHSKSKENKDKKNNDPKATKKPSGPTTRRPRPPIPTDTATRNCTSLVGGQTIPEICSGVCYDCACGDSHLNKTCYDTCLLIFRSDQICNMSITTTVANPNPDEPAFAECAADIYTDRPLYLSTDNFCNQACECCAINKKDLECFTKCQDSALFTIIGQACASVKGDEIFKGLLKNLTDTGNCDDKNKHHGGGRGGHGGGGHGGGSNSHSHSGGKSKRGGGGGGNNHGPGRGRK